MLVVFNWLVIEFRIVENASIGGDICGKVVGIVGRAGEARGSIGRVDSGDESFDPKDDIRSKNKALIALALKRVDAMAKVALKGQYQWPEKGD